LYFFSVFDHTNFPKRYPPAPFHFPRFFVSLFPHARTGTWCDFFLVFGRIIASPSFVAEVPYFVFFACVFFSVPFPVFCGICSFLSLFFHVPKSSISFPSVFPLREFFHVCRFIFPHPTILFSQIFCQPPFPFCVKSRRLLPQFVHPFFLMFHFFSWFLSFGRGFLPSPLIAIPYWFLCVPSYRFFPLFCPPPFYFALASLHLSFLFFLCFAL